METQYVYLMEYSSETEWQKTAVVTKMTQPYLEREHTRGKRMLALQKIPVMEILTKNNQRFDVMTKRKEG